MYTYIRGKLTATLPLSIVLEAGPIGYKIRIPPNFFSKLPAIGEEIFVYLSFVIRENSQSLYGFETEKERDLFEILLTISGIGPKLSLSLIGHLGVENLQRAIAEKDLRTICRVPGIGKKGAERLIVEMQDGLRSFSTSAINLEGIAIPHNQKTYDGISALMNLGYSHSVAQKAIQKSMETLPEGIDLGNLITHALKLV